MKINKTKLLIYLHILCVLIKANKVSDSQRAEVKICEALDEGAWH